MKFEINGGEIMARMTLNIDGSKLDRECFGIFRWRIKLSFFFMRIAARVLRCGIHITDGD